MNNNIQTFFCFKSIGVPKYLKKGMNIIHRLFLRVGFYFQE